MAVPVVTCEDCIETMGDWWGASNEGTGYLDRAEWDWTGDGIPYETFKAIEENAVAQAFVVERADGTFIGYNAGVLLDGKTRELSSHSIFVRR